MHTKNPLAYSQEKITFGLKSVFVAATAGDVLTFLQIFLVIVTTNTTKVFPTSHQKYQLLEASNTAGDALTSLQKYLFFVSPYIAKDVLTSRHKIMFLSP